MSSDVEMSISTFQDALKSMDFQKILNWMDETKESPDILFFTFTEQYFDKEVEKREPNRNLITEDRGLVGNTSFHYAIEQRKPLNNLFEELVDLVFQKRHEISEHIGTIDDPEEFWKLRNVRGRSVLETAVENDDVRALQKIISTGADILLVKVTLPDRPESSTNLVSFSIACQAENVFKEVLRHDGKLNTWDESGRSPAHIAAMYGNLTALRTLIEDTPVRVEDQSENFETEHFYTKEDYVKKEKSHFLASSIESRGSSMNNSGRASAVQDLNDDNSETIASFDQTESFIELERLRFHQNDSEVHVEEDDETTMENPAYNNIYTNYSDELLRNDEERRLVEMLTNLEAEEKSVYISQPEFNSNLFHYAVDNNQLDTVSFLITLHGIREQRFEARADGMTPLHLAARNNSESILQLLLEEGDVSIDIKNDITGSKPIHIACENGAKAALGFLLKHGTNVNSRDHNGFTPLHYACSKEDNIDCVEILVEAGADVNCMSIERETAAYAAIARWNLKIFWILMDRGADPSIPHKDGTVVLGFIAANSVFELGKFADFCRNKSFKEKVDFDLPIGEEGHTPLHIAVQKCSPDTVRSLVSVGASILKANEDGDTPFSNAMKPHEWPRRRHEKLILALLSEKPDIASNGLLSLYPLHFACQNKFHKLSICLLDLGVGCNVKRESEVPLHVSSKVTDYTGMRILLSRGADVKMIDKTGCTPFLVCIKEHFVEGIELLSQFGSLPSDFNNRNENGFHLSSAKRTRRIGEVLRCIKRSEGLIECFNTDGERPIHVHIRKGQIDGIKFLIRQGCDVNGTTEDNKTPLMVACELGSITAVKLLLEANAEVNYINKSGHTSLFYFSENESNALCILRLLIIKGAELNHTDGDGDTILHEAALGNHARIIRFLASSGIDINIQNKNGETALHMATKAGFVEAVEELLFGPSGSVLADLKLTNMSGVSAYRLARSEGHTEIIAIFLKFMRISLSNVAPTSLFIETACYESNGIVSNHGDELCVVCQEGLKSGQVIRKLLCGHKFHDCCILTWLGGELMQKSIECPICKQVIGPEQV